MFRNPGDFKMVSFISFACLILMVSFSLSKTVPQLIKPGNNTEVMGAKTVAKDLPKCTDADLRIADLSNDVSKNPTAVTFLRENCRVLATAEYIPVKGDSSTSLVLTTVGFGCGSCHVHEITIFDGYKIIFDKTGDELAIRKSTLTPGFEITEPLRRADKSMANPVEAIVYTYKYSPSSKRPVEDTVNSVYKSLSSYSNDGSNDYFYLFDTRSEQY